jgi:hypothetical protein
MSRANLTVNESVRRNNEFARIRRKRRLMERTPMHYSARIARQNNTEFETFPWWVRIIGKVIKWWYRLMKKPMNYNMTLDQLRSYHGAK